MWKYQGKLEKSRLDEQSFIRAIHRKDMDATVTKTSEVDDINRHVDLKVVFSTGKVMTTDVKGDFGYSYYKDGQRIFGNDARWVELVNVQGGRGWVDGDASTIAFRRNGQWIVVSRVDLYNLVVQQTTGKPVTTIKTNAFYQPYRRQGRQDVVVLVPWSDIQKLRHLVLDMGE